MSSCILSKNLPITRIQLTLNDLFGENITFKDHLKNKLYPKEEGGWDENNVPELELNKNMILCLKDPYCPYCNEHLSKWGTNERKIILDHGEVPEINGIQRYRCKKHGEMSDYLNAIVPKYANYAEGFKKRSVNLYFIGQVPSMIRKTFNICYGNTPECTSIRNWVDKSTEDINKCVSKISVPVSGYHGYDEIYIKVKGEKSYVLTAIDLNTHFATGAKYSPAVNKKHLKSFLQTLKCGPKNDIKGLIKDGVFSFGNLFNKRGFNKISIQRCQAHYKKNLNGKIYEAAGLGNKLKKPLPEPFDKVKKALFAPFNRSTYIRAIFQLEWADHCLRGKVNSKIDKILDDFHRDADKLFQYHINTQLEHTNNRDERFNLELETYPSLKKRMMTDEGVQRVINGERFLHNLKEFPKYIKGVEKRIESLDELIAQGKDNNDLKRVRSGAKIHLSYVKKWKANYDEVFNQYFKISKKSWRKNKRKNH